MLVASGRASEVIAATPRVLFSCVGEDRPDWHQKMGNLVLSIRRFGGALAQAPVVVNVVGSAERGFVERMDRLDALVQVVQPVDAGRPTFNKLRMLELTQPDFDVLVALDCDLILRGDITAELRPDELRAVPAGRSHLPARAWQRLYERRQLALPPKATVMAVSGEMTYPYFNSGVVFVPRSSCSLLRRHWHLQREWVRTPPGVEFTGEQAGKDQVPFALALASSGVSVRALPVNLNLSVTRLRPAKPYRRQWGPPFFFHYHRLTDARGFLLPSPNTRINTYLDEFNQARADHLGLAYAGLGRVPLRRQVGAVLDDKPGYRWARAVTRPARDRAGRP